MTKGNKPRVLIISQLPPPYSGLTNNIELYLSSSLANAYDLTCLNLSAGLTREKNPDKPSLITALYAIFVIFKLVYLLTTSSPQLVYMKAGTKWGFMRDFFVILICKLFRKKLICHLHSKSSDTLFLDRRPLRTIFHYGMSLPDKVIVLSDNLKSGFSKFIERENLEVIENIVNTSLFTRDSYLNAGNDNILQQKNYIEILFVGRLSESKGIWDLLEVMRGIMSQVINVELELAGVAEDKKSESEIFRYCMNSPFKDRIRLHGIIQESRKIFTFMNADIFVLPTHNDNVPNVILEAMAAGLPIVSTNVGQIPNMVEDGTNGFIIEAGDVKGLDEKLRLLIDSQDLRRIMGQRNYHKARKVYDVEVGAQKMHKIFESLLL